ncbi:hypothetical protein AGMMS4952_14980 [Spirochaetia bacterium]|nr:hypothetical protein AGMMS4952_14980 [Spirochaetia bacterium]
MYGRSYGNVRELNVSGKECREGQAGYKKSGLLPGSGEKRPKQGGEGNTKGANLPVSPSVGTKRGEKDGE